MWQMVPLEKEQSHLMAGLKSELPKSVESMAAPLHGSPLKFHFADAILPHLPSIVFKAVTVIYAYISTYINIYLYISKYIHIYIYINTQVYNPFKHLMLHSSTPISQLFDFVIKQA